MNRKILIILILLLFLIPQPAASTKIMFYTTDLVEYECNQIAIGIIAPVNNSFLTKQTQLIISTNNLTHNLYIQADETTLVIRPNETLLSLVNIDIPLYPFNLTISHNNITILHRHYTTDPSGKIPTAPATPEITNIDNIIQEQDEIIDDIITTTQDERYEEESPYEYTYLEVILYAVKWLVILFFCFLATLGLTRHIRKGANRAFDSPFKHPILRLIVVAFVMIFLVYIMSIIGPEIDKQYQADAMREMIIELDIPPELYQEYDQYITEKYTPSWQSATNVILSILTALLVISFCLYGMIWGYSRFSPSGNVISIVEHDFSDPKYTFIATENIYNSRRDHIGLYHLTDARDKSPRRAFAEMRGKDISFSCVLIGEKNESIQSQFNEIDCLYVDNIVKTDIADPEVQKALINQQLSLHKQQSSEFISIAEKIYHAILSRIGLKAPIPTEIYKVYLSTVHTGPRILLDKDYERNIRNLVKTTRNLVKQLTSLDELTKLANVAQDVLSDLSIWTYLKKDDDKITELEAAKARIDELQDLIPSIERRINTDMETEEAATYG